MAKVRVQYLTINGLKSDTEDKKAGPGNVFVILLFEGRQEVPKKEESGLVTLSSGDDGRLEAKDNSTTGEPDLWLTDKQGVRYSDWSSYWEKESGSIAFEVPQNITGLVFHDGRDRAYPIRPSPASPPTPSPAAGAK